MHKYLFLYYICVYYIEYDHLYEISLGTICMQLHLLCSGLRNMNSISLNYLSFQNCIILHFCLQNKSHNIIDGQNIMRNDVRITKQCEISFKLAWVFVGGCLKYYSRFFYFDIESSILLEGNPI